MAARRPSPWPDAATPWFEHLRAVSPAAWAIDRLNDVVYVAPDLPLGSILVIVAIAACTLASSLAAEVPIPIALGAALGLAATRTLWSTAVDGRDAFPALVMAGTLLTTVRGGPFGARLAACAGAVLVPPTVWLVAPAAIRGRETHRGNWMWPLVVAALGVTATLGSLHHAWVATTCLPVGQWTAAIAGVLRPSLAADASPLLAWRQAFGILVQDVHPFGVLVAVHGLMAAAPRAQPHVRRTVALTVAILVATLGAGLTPPAFGIAMLMPWWAVAFALGLASLTREVRGRWRSLAYVACVVAAAVVPVLRHAVVTPGPWVASMPAITRALAPTWPGVVATSDGAETRRLRVAGVRVVPADRAALEACVSSGREVDVLGASIGVVERWGFDLSESAVFAPLSAVLSDLRGDQLAALALAPEAASWAGTAGTTMLARLSVARGGLVGGPATVVVGRTDRPDAEVRQGRDGVDVRLRVGDRVGGRALLRDVSASARVDATSVDARGVRLATGRIASIAVFDRGQDVVLQAVGLARPGLPISLAQHAAWRRAVVHAAPAGCTSASARWTALASASRYSLPVRAASAGRPVLAYVGTTLDVPVRVTGLPVRANAPGWVAETFDTRVPEAADRLHAREAADGVPDERRLHARWITRVSVTPIASWDASRVVVTSGGEAGDWLVRLAANGRLDDTVAVCPLAVTGERLLDGHSGVTDDESHLEAAVRTAGGWNDAEHVAGTVFQWTSSPVAAVSFHADGKDSLTLALDATGAGVAGEPQPITVRLNGEVLRADWQGAGRIDLPRALVRPRGNTLTLEVGQVVRPPGDTRALGVLVRHLRVIRRRTP